MFSGIDRKKLLFQLIISGLFIVVVVCVGIYLAVVNFNEPTSTFSPTPTASRLVILQQARKGELIDGFPSGLVVAKDALITGSAENSSTDPGKQIFVTSYETNLTLSVINQNYLDYFSKQGWTVAQNQKNGNQFSISASKPSYGYVSIDFFKKAGTNLVVVLLNKQK